MDKKKEKTHLNLVDIHSLLKGRKINSLTDEELSEIVSEILKQISPDSQKSSKEEPPDLKSYWTAGKLPVDSSYLLTKFVREPQITYKNSNRSFFESMDTKFKAKYIKYNEYLTGHIYTMILLSFFHLIFWL